MKLIPSNVFSALLLLGAMWSSSPLYAQVSISRQLSPDAEHGAGFVKKEIAVQIPNGSIEYTGIGEEGIAGDIKDLRFGLSFHRPPVTNGGWDIWNFMRVGISAKGMAPFDATSRYLLDHVELLEEGERTVLQFTWNLIQEDAKLIVTTIQYPSQPEWIFTRIRVEGDEADIASVTLSCFPGNTTGPEERERWMDSTNGPQPLSGEDMTIEASTPGYVFYNKMVQDSSGCLLVVDTSQVEMAKVNGAYNVSARLSLQPGSKEIVMAFGGFLENSPEDVARVFKMEGTTNTLNFLKRIDWNAKVDTGRQLALVTEIEKMLQGKTDPALVKRFEELRSRYQQAKSAGQAERLHDAFRELSALKEALVADQLNQLK